MAAIQLIGTPLLPDHPRRLAIGPEEKPGHLLVCRPDGSELASVRLPLPWRSRMLAVMIVIAVVVAFPLALMQLRLTSAWNGAFWICAGLAALGCFAAPRLALLLVGLPPITFRRPGEARPQLLLRRRVTWIPLAVRRSVHGPDGPIGEIVLRGSTWRARSAAGEVRFLANDAEMTRANLRLFGRRERRLPLELRTPAGGLVAVVDWSGGADWFEVDFATIPAEVEPDLVVACAVLVDQASVHRV
jgi:hypothetical protein